MQKHLLRTMLGILVKKKLFNVLQFLLKHVVNSFVKSPREKQQQSIDPIRMSFEEKKFTLMHEICDVYTGPNSLNYD